MEPTTQPQPLFLVMDIGGTNTRFKVISLPINRVPSSILSAYFHTQPSPLPSPIPTSDPILFSQLNNQNFIDSSQIQIIYQKNYLSQSFISLEQAMGSFFSQAPSELSLSPKKLILTLAGCGPVVKQRIESMANLGWNDIDAKQLKQKGFIDVFITNDFEAFGYGLALAGTMGDLGLMFGARDLLDTQGKLTQMAADFGAVQTSQPDFEIKDFHDLGSKTLMAIGVGTGVGVVALKSYLNIEKNNFLLEVMSSESGHTYFGPKQNPLDLQLLKFIAGCRGIDLSSEYVPFECFVSSLSFPLIYDFLRRQTPELKSSNRHLNTIEIWKLACESDPLAMQTVEYYIDLFGQFIHQTSLTFLPDIIVLSGKCMESLQKIVSKFPKMKERFWKSFLGKSHMAPTHQNVPVFWLKNERFSLSELGSLLAYFELVR